MSCCQPRQCQPAISTSHSENKGTPDRRLQQCLLCALYTQTVFNVSFYHKFFFEDSRRAVESLCFLILFTRECYI